MKQLLTMVVIDNDDGTFTVSAGVSDNDAEPLEFTKTWPDQVSALRGAAGLLSGMAAMAEAEAKESR